jgi:hypothetical protein
MDHIEDAKIFRPDGPGQEYTVENPPAAWRQSRRQ